MVGCLVSEACRGLVGVGFACRGLVFCGGAYRGLMWAPDHCVLEDLAVWMSCSEWSGRGICE